MATVNDGTARAYTLQNLQEFSGYAITVQANNTGGTNSSNVITVTTLASGSHNYYASEDASNIAFSFSAPSGPPQSVMTSSVTSSSITVQWDRVSCIHRNSEITGYTVRYQTGGAIIVNESKLTSGISDSDRVFTASGLIPRTNYTFEVAAVSSEGIGPFSTGTTTETTVPEGEVYSSKMLCYCYVYSLGTALQLSGQRYSNNSLVTLTDIGEGDTTALLCLTDREQCCRARDGNPAGNWYFPNGSQVQAGAGSGSIYRTRDASRVLLNREDSAESPTGVYRCEVPNANGTDRSIYIGLYIESGGINVIMAYPITLF